MKKIRRRKKPCITTHGINRPRLSMYTIVKDEGARLEGFLAGVRGFADEIVVVDTGSIDDNKEITRKMGAIVITHPWNDDFSEAAMHHSSVPQVIGY